MYIHYFAKMNYHYVGYQHYRKDYFLPSDSIWMVPGSIGPDDE